MHRIALLSLAFLLVGLCAVPSARAGDDLPPVFDKRPYADARKAAMEGKKWFIVKATAVWCPPCQQMDKTTWRDETVVEWLKKNAIIVALDVDKEQKLAEGLSIESMPTMVAFKDGDKEFDRVVGYKPSPVMLAWLEGLARGEKSIEAVRKRAQAPADGRVDVRARMELARSLAMDRKYLEAADEYLWLWKNMLEHEPAMYGVRLSFMASDMDGLARKSEEARGKFVALRDETGKRMEGEKVEMEDVADWVVLNNRVLNDADATVKWFERVKDQPKWQPFINRVSFDLTEMFIELGRWADVGRLSIDPLAELQSDWQLLKLTSGHELPKGLNKEERKQLEEMPRQMFREKTGQRYAGLLAAEREELAERLAAKAREHDPSIHMVKTLVGTALDAGQARAVHLNWITAAKDTSLESLGKRVTEALAKKAPPK